MPNLVSDAVVAAAKGVGKGVYHAGLAGGARRVATGMLAGGIIGGATTDSNTGTGFFRSMMGGALMGAGIGGLTTRTFRRAAWGGLKGLSRGLGRGARRGAWPAVKGGVRLGVGLGRGAVNFALNNPVLTGTVGAVGLGGYIMFGTQTHGHRAVATEQMGAMMENYGPSEGMTRLHSSTQGLVQGLHAGRHS